MFCVARRGQASFMHEVATLYRCEWTTRALGPARPPARPHLRTRRLCLFFHKRVGLRLLLCCWLLRWVGYVPLPSFVFLVLVPVVHALRRCSLQMWSFGGICMLA